jgi:hypothetical protein
MNKGSGEGGRHGAALLIWEQIPTSSFPPLWCLGAFSFLRLLALLLLLLRCSRFLCLLRLPGTGQRPAQQAHYEETLND